MTDTPKNPANLKQVVTQAPTKDANASKSGTQTTKTAQPTPAPAATPAAPIADELATLKARAKVMGIKHSPNIGLEALKELVNTRTQEVAKETPATIVTPAPQAPTPTVPENESPLQMQLRVRQELIAEQTKLVRCRIECMNPAKSDLKGEIFTTGNRFIGKISKFIAYGEDTDDGYHIPFMLYQMLKDKKFLKITREKIKGTNNYVNTRRLVPEFSIEVLPQLTEQELKELADRQTAQKSID